MLFANRLKYYKRLADISIYRWDMLHKEDNVRWLLKGDNSEKELSVVQYNILNVAYKELLLQFKKLELPLLKKKCQIAIKVIDFILETIEGTTDIKILENAETIMMGLLITDNPDISWIHNVKIAETADQRMILTELAVAIQDFNSQKEKDKDRPKQTLEEQSARMSNILGFNIDVKTTNILQFIAFQKEANEKINLYNGRR